MPLAGVILAAGRSARMGTPKALLDFRGAPFVVRILEALEALDLKTRAAVVPAFGERRGHPVIWDAPLFGELEGNAAASTEGARAVLHAHAADVATVAVDDPAVIDDLNTPQDYERLVREVNRDAY